MNRPSNIPKDCPTRLSNIFSYLLHKNVLKGLTYNASLIHQIDTIVLKWPAGQVKCSYIYKTIEIEIARVLITKNMTLMK